MPLETNLETIGQLAEERKDENWEFRAFLKQCDDDEVDERVRPIVEEVTAGIDCTTCGNCCADLRPEMKEPDIERLAGCLSMTPDEFREKHMGKSEHGSAVLRGKPCAFLKEKRCTVYTNRPAACRSYPHLDKEGFTFRLIDIISNYAVCPIVFNVFERLKDDMWRGRRKRQ